MASDPMLDVLREIVDDADPSEGFHATLSSLFMEKHGHALLARLEAMERDEKLVQFGSWCFERYWNDGAPGDLDWDLLQEEALRLGLLRHRLPGDGDEDCMCGESDNCECLWPTVRAIRARGQS